MRIILLIFTWAFCYVSQAQNSDLIDCCGEDKSHVFVYGGIVFEPFNESSNISDAALCSAYEEEFYLNGLRIDKASFINLQLLSQHLSNDSTTLFNRKKSKRGYGTYEYSYETGIDCANKIIFRVATKLPISLNGKELSAAEQKDKLSLIEPDSIIAIIRKPGFYKTGKIEITIK